MQKKFLSFLLAATLWQTQIAMGQPAGMGQQSPMGQQIAMRQQAGIGQQIADKTFDPSTLLWFTKPAAKWEDALPVGNGRLGAMVFGRTEEETIQFNEDTYWTGGPYSTVVKGGYQHLPEVQRLVNNGDFQKAHDLFGRALMGYPVEQQKYQSLAELHIFWASRDSSEYKRWLDLETGIVGKEFVSGGVKYRQEILSSAVDQVVAIRITASRPGSIRFSAALRGVRNQAHSNYATDYFHMDGDGNDGLVVTGKSADYLGVEGKLRYEARIRAVPEGGQVRVEDGLLKVENADAVTLYFAAATNFVNYKDVSGDEHARVKATFAGMAGKTWSQVLEAHLRDYQSLFGRVALRLPLSPLSWLPTDERKKRNNQEADASLSALAYQFGRYLLIASSRPGTQPANLQGIWNNSQNPMWDSKYTTNINTQENYWAVESANLAECAEPLIRMVKELTDQGAQVARESYGCNGWVFHQNTDLWRVAAPMDGPTWGTFTVGGAWLCTHLWEHYLFSKDTAYLRDVYPTLKGAVVFFTEFLTPHPNGKWLVTNPSTSPENFPDRPGNGRYFDEVTGSFLPGTSICAGSAIDMEILHDLFGYYIEAAKVLGTDSDLAKKVAALRARLVPPQISHDGTLQEWTEDWGQTEHPHRHVSLLYGLYPGNVFSIDSTPQWIGACRNSLLQRGDESAEWARPWKAAMWARLRDGNHADKIIRGYFYDASNPQFFGNAGFPVQVDGPLAVTAALTEMLLQSQEGNIDLLPALPVDWKEGSFRGLKARGDFEVAATWKEGRLNKAEIVSLKGGPCSLRLPVRLPMQQDGAAAGRGTLVNAASGTLVSVGRIIIVAANGRKVKTESPAAGILRFATAKNQRYSLTIK